MYAISEKFSLSRLDRKVQNHCSPFLRRSPPSLAAISAELLHVHVRVQGNPPPRLKLLQPYTPFQFPHSDCPLKYRQLEAFELVEYLLKEHWQFSDVVLLTIPLLLL